MYQIYDAPVTVASIEAECRGSGAFFFQFCKHPDLKKRLSLKTKESPAIPDEGERVPNDFPINELHTVGTAAKQSFHVLSTKIDIIHKTENRYMRV